MTLDQIITQYIAYRKALGEKFITNESYLKAFTKAIGPSADIQSISKEAINNFLYNNAEMVTPAWFVKYSALLGFYQYLLSHQYINEIPLPTVLPKKLPSFIPYIYSKKELKLIFDTALTYQVIKSYVQPFMIRIILILTYALGLRIGETLSLTLGNLDMDHSVIKIEHSKCYKSRLVPFNPQIKEVIAEYLKFRIKQNQPNSSESFLFIGKNNKSLNLGIMQEIFQRIRTKAGIKREDNASFQPRIHDLRHTFAVNRLTSWYQENKNVQQLLPILSTYLGHTHLTHTTVYLTMTDQLLQEASSLFEKYAIGEFK